MERHPKSLASSTDVTPHMNLRNQLNVRVLHIVSYMKSSFNISYISTAVLPGLKENLMHAHFTLKSALVDMCCNFEVNGDDLTHTATT
jgi:hypothetical protein